MADYCISFIILMYALNWITKTIRYHHCSLIHYTNTHQTCVPAVKLRNNKTTQITN